MGWKKRESANRFLLVVVLVLGSIGAGMSYAAAKPVIRLGTEVPRGTTVYKLLTEMGEKWRDAPGGGARLII